MARGRSYRGRKAPRLADSVAPRRGSAGTFFRWLFLLVFVAAVLGVAGLGVVFLYYGLDPDLPRLDRIGDYHPKVVTRVVDRDGELLGEIYEERRTVMPRDKIPALMIHAIVDAEDAQFYEHKGLNYTGMLRAFLNNLRPGAHLQGGSTITQQLVKTYLLKTNERTVKRKVQEVILARRLESALSKDEILYVYLNQIYFGHLRYGVEEAARFYFGKSISDVNAGEAALLASLPKGPEEISPLKHPERAKDRQRYVLSQMLRYGHVTREDAERFAAAPIEVVRPPASLGVAPEFVDQAKRELSTRHGDPKVMEAWRERSKSANVPAPDFFTVCPSCSYLGATVRTTCDARIQRLAREALERNLEGLDERQGYRKPLTHLKTVSPATIKALLVERALARLQARLRAAPTRKQREATLHAREQALAQARPVEATVVEVRTGDERGTGAGLVVDAAPARGFMPVLQKLEGKPDSRKDRYNPKGLPIDKRFAVGDVIFVRAEPSLGRTEEGLPIVVPEFGPQGAAMVIDPLTREVKAIVGGYDAHPGGFNRALQAARQPGSAFKPFLYATAFTSAKYTPASVLNDSPQVFDLPGFKEWAPKNAESHQFLGPVRLRVALAKSLNTVAAQLVLALTPEAVAQTARLAGIESLLSKQSDDDDNEPAGKDELSIGLGASEVTLAELTNAYATLAAQGKKAPARLFTAFGADLEPVIEAQPALQPEIAYLVTSVMESVIEEGTAVAAKGKLKRPAAGKTGTTNGERDAWFVGFTPDLVAGVWVGFDDMRELGHGEQGARAALPVWIDVMNGALKGVPPKPFAQPPTIVVQKIDPVTGLLAEPGAPNAIDEVFLAGTTPTQVAPQAGEQNPETFIIDQQ